MTLTSKIFSLAATAMLTLTLISAVPLHAQQPDTSNTASVPTDAQKNQEKDQKKQLKADRKADKAKAKAAKQQQKALDAQDQATKASQKAAKPQ